MEKTQGCLRAYDSDISFVKTLTDELSASNPDEVPGNVTIVDDLERIIVPVSTSNKVEISVQYSIPEDISNIYEMIRKKYGL